MNEGEEGERPLFWLWVSGLGVEGDEGEEEDGRLIKDHVQGHAAI